MAKKSRKSAPEVMRQIEKAIYLRSIDTFWMNHLDDMDYLREGIGLRGYGQRDPLVEYKKEGYLLFQNLLGVDPQCGREHNFQNRSRQRGTARAKKYS